MAEIIYTLLGFLPLLLGFLIGLAIERSHLRRLDREEQALSHILVSNMKRLPANWQDSEGVLVVGEMVVATDYFKVFAASLRNLFGGRVRSYINLVDRARREALVRMLKQAQTAGANVVWNVRVETITIQGKRKGKSGGVEVFAYGTAMKVRSE